MPPAFSLGELTLRDHSFLETRAPTSNRQTIACALPSRVFMLTSSSRNPSDSGPVITEPKISVDDVANLAERSVPHSEPKSFTYSYPIELDFYQLVKSVVSVAFSCPVNTLIGRQSGDSRPSLISGVSQGVSGLSNTVRRCHTRSTANQSPVVGCFTVQARRTGCSTRMLPHG
jgi:hypothetical protein